MNIQAAQINVVIGNLRQNTDKIKELISKVPSDVDMIVFPELSITGYPPSDLLLRAGFVEEQVEMANEIRAFSKTHARLAIVLGLAVPNQGIGKPFFNSLWVIRNGVILLQYNKQLLPTYDVFDEARYFEAGSPSQHQTVEISGMEVGFLICEDAWNDQGENQRYSANPVRYICEKNIDLLVTINASPSHIGKAGLRMEMYGGIAKRYKLPVVYVNQVGGHDSLIFDGNSFIIYPEGEYEGAGSFIERTALFTTEEVGFPYTPSTDKYGEIYQHLCLGIRDYVHKNGFKDIVVGSSGGIDSAVVLALAEQALGAEHVFAITMPSKFSSVGSVDDSVKLCENLGIRLFNRCIADDVELNIAKYEETFGGKPKRLAIENIQARTRGLILMEFSNDLNCLVLSTGNKTETSVGYCTLYGDMCGGLAVIGDLYKMEVYGLADWMNTNVYAPRSEGGGEGIPKNIIDKAPSAELWEGQQDTDSLPPYPVLDALLRLYVEGDLIAKAEKEVCQNAVKCLTIEQIEKYLRMTDKAEFKRQQAPPILKVQRRSFGAGRTLPITQAYRPTYRNVL